MLYTYHYDGTFAGFLSCVFDIYQYKERPADFFGPDDERISLYESRQVATHQAHAKRVYDYLRKQLSADGRTLAANGFLTCMPQKEKAVFDFIDLGCQMGPAVVRHLTDDRVARLTKAVNHLTHEAHLYTGFVRFSEAQGLLLGEIEPKNRVLPLLRPHFCNRYKNECFVLHDRTHKEAIFYQPGQWVITPVDELTLPPPSQAEREYRALWRAFYNAIAIEGRLNPKLRQGNMPKRYWAMLTEFQTEDGARALPTEKMP